MLSSPGTLPSLKRLPGLGVRSNSRTLRGAGAPPEETAAALRLGPALCVAAHAGAAVRSGAAAPMVGAKPGVAAAMGSPGGGPRRSGAGGGYSDCGVLSSTGTRKVPSRISWVRSATIALTSSGSLSSQAW